MQPNVIASSPSLFAALVLLCAWPMSVDAQGTPTAPTDERASPPADSESPSADDGDEAPAEFGLDDPRGHIRAATVAPADDDADADDADPYEDEFDDDPYADEFGDPYANDFDDAYEDEDEGPYADYLRSTRRHRGPRGRGRRGDTVIANERPEGGEPAPLCAVMEVSIGMAPGFGFGLGAISGGGLAGLAGLDGFSIAGRTDFVFSVNDRVFLGLGLGASHAQAISGSTTNYDRVDLPLIAQVYFESPRVGVAVPTLRVSPAFHWDSISTSTTSTRETVGGALTFGIGVTYFVADWLAIRLLGDVGASVAVAYSGIEGQSVNVFVGGDLGVVIRL